MNIMNTILNVQICYGFNLMVYAKIVKISLKLEQILFETQVLHNYYDKKV